MLPRARRPHDQLLRSIQQDAGIAPGGQERSDSGIAPGGQERSDSGIKSHWIAGLGGLLIGHILWLVAIKLAIAAPAINFWVLVVAAVIAVVAAISFFVGWRLYKREVYGWAIFLLALPVSPVLFTIAVLGVTYL